MYHVNVNVNLMVGIVTQVKSVINVGVNAKVQHNIMHVKEIIFGTLALAFVRMVNI